MSYIMVDTVVRELHVASLGSEVLMAKVHIEAA